MRVAITGATGNVGTSLLARLATDPQASQITAIARRLPEMIVPKTTWRKADVVTDPLEELFTGMDAVFHLAWAIQPSREPAELRNVNLVGSLRVFDAVASQGVSTLIYASSLGAYAPGPRDRLVDESWPTGGVMTSFYGRHKAMVERHLDQFEQRYPDIRVVRLRPALIFKREAATGIKRLFAGPLFPSSLLRWPIPLVPVPKELDFQTVHTEDVALAYQAALHQSVRGAFNIAADPVLTPNDLAEVVGGRRVDVPLKLLRSAVALSWRARLQPTPPGWVDMGAAAPLLDSARARSELGWKPRHSPREALEELVDGLAGGAYYPTPPLSPDAVPARSPRAGVPVPSVPWEMTGRTSSSVRRSE
jgi:UDP-glucose 4-epimerase